MKLYAAPMEGLTGFVWRNAHRKVFGNTDKYYTPFLSASNSRVFQPKEIRDISQGEQDIVPQLLSNNEELFIWGARELQSMGFQEINLNIGCPSGTVTAKRKGAGMLYDVESLDRILDALYTEVTDMTISVKTRIGVNDKAEWDQILAVYNKYPISELIIHPRIRKDFYKGDADYALYKETERKTELPLVYNGDITEISDAPLAEGKDVMVGRGVLRNPALFREIRGGAPATVDELKEYHLLMLDGYQTYMTAENAVRHLKDQWKCWLDFFDCDERMVKKMRKAKKLNEYLPLAESIIESL